MYIGCDMIQAFRHGYRKSAQCKAASSRREMHHAPSAVRRRLRDSRTGRQLGLFGHARFPLT